MHKRYLQHQWPWFHFTHRLGIQHLKPLVKVHHVTWVVAMNVRKWAILTLVCLRLLCLLTPSDGGEELDVTCRERCVKVSVSCEVRVQIQHRRLCADWNRKLTVLFVASLLLEGDIHPNPGPRPKFLCLVCARAVRCEGIQCDEGDRWCHPSCAHLSSREYLRLGSCDDLLPSQTN